MNYPYTDLMVDIETWDVKESAVVLSIGMVAFDPNEVEDLKQLAELAKDERGNSDRLRYYALDPSDQLAKGRTVSADTLKWWIGQSTEAKTAATKDPQSPIQVIYSMQRWLMRRPELRYVWGNGATFDISIMKSLFNDYRVPWPFRYSGDMDLRTLKRFAPSGTNLKKDIKGLTAHNALHDAIWQVAAVQTALDVEGDTDV